MLFIGQHEHTIDTKLRLSIPADIRREWSPEQHGSHWCAMPWWGPSPSIRLYTAASHREVSESYRQGLTLDPDAAQMAALVFGQTQKIPHDAAGRIRLTPSLHGHLGSPKDVALVGAGDWLEIRDLAQWRSTLTARSKELPELWSRIAAKRAAAVPRALPDPPVPPPDPHHGGNGV